MEGWLKAELYSGKKDGEAADCGYIILHCCKLLDTKTLTNLFNVLSWEKTSLIPFSFFVSCSLLISVDCVAMPSCFLSRSSGLSRGFTELP
jgi:hypothetical protein